jgi:hypothetical protein
VSAPLHVSVSVCRWILHTSLSLPLPPLPSFCMVGDGGMYRIISLLISKSVAPLYRSILCACRVVCSLSSLLFSPLLSYLLRFGNCEPRHLHCCYIHTTCICPYKSNIRLQFQLPSVKSYMITHFCCGSSSYSLSLWSAFAL